MKIITIGLDLAKSVSQVHGVDATGQVVVRQQSQLTASTGRTEDCTRPRHCVNLTLATREPSTENIRGSHRYVCLGANTGLIAAQKGRPIRSPRRRGRQCQAARRRRAFLQFSG